MERSYLLWDKAFYFPLVLRSIASLEHTRASDTHVLGISSQSHAFCGGLTQPLITQNTKEYNISPQIGDRISIMWAHSICEVKRKRQGSRCGVISRCFQYTTWLVYYLPYPKYVLKGLSKLWKNNHLPIIKGGEYTCWSVTLVLWFLWLCKTHGPHSLVCFQISMEKSTIYLSCIKKKV